MTRRLRFLSDAINHITEIASYIAEQSGSRAVASLFVASLKAECTKIARLEIAIGRLRAELKPDLRSATFGNYVIFFQYRRATVEIVAILERHRDADAFFGERKDG